MSRSGMSEREPADPPGQRGPAPLKPAARGRRCSLVRAFRGPGSGKRIAALAIVLLGLGAGADQLFLRREARLGWLPRLPTAAVAGLAAAGDAAADYELGRRQQLDGNTAAAARSFQRASERDPEFATARGAYANLLVDLHRDNEAYELAQGSLSQEPTSVPAGLALGRLRARRREWTGGLAAAETLLARHPDSAGAWLLQAECQAGRRQWREAARSAARAVALEPRLWEGWVARSRAVREQGDAAESLRCAARAARLRPAEAAAQRALGLALLAAGRPEGLPRAEAALAAALRLDPASEEARLGWGRLLVRQGRWAAARSHLEATLRIWPEANAARALLAEVALQQGDAAGARRWQAEHARWAAFLARKTPLQDRIERSEYEHRARFDLARLYAGMGLWSQARRELELGLRRGPDPVGLALRREFDRRQPEQR
jgi:predicted Zn-dependent protease